MQPYIPLLSKLKKGMAFTTMPANFFPKNIPVTEVQKMANIAYQSAKSNKMLEGWLGQDAAVAQADLVASLKSGAFIPDQVAGVSVKTLLAALAVVLFLKRR